MNDEKGAGAFALFVGAAMMAMWLMLYVGGEITELTTKPVEIGFHLTAEFSTAFLLALSGLGLLRGRPWSRKAFLFSDGMLAYTLIQSPGYYLARGEWQFVLMFTILLIFSITFAIVLLKENGQ